MNADRTFGTVTGNFAKIDHRQGGSRLTDAFKTAARDARRRRCAGSSTANATPRQSEVLMRSINRMIGRYPAAVWHHACILLALAAFVGLSLTGPSGPAFSQAVQLLKVDVSVVGKGLRVSQLTGQNVVNEKNESVGKLDDIVIGEDRSIYAILQVGGFLGLNSRLVAVPYESLKIQEENGKVQKIALPGASRDELKRLAEFRYSS
jgi:sporulation protein YlmC with PRC-barrel domain